MFSQMKAINFFTFILLATHSFRSVSCVQHRYVYEGSEECNEKDNSCDCSVNEVNENDVDGNVRSVVQTMTCYKRPESLYEASLTIFRDVKRGFHEVVGKTWKGLEYGKDKASQGWQYVHEHWSQSSLSKSPAWINVKSSVTHSLTKTKAISQECWNGFVTLTDQGLGKLEKYLARLRGTVNSNNN